MKLLIDHPVLPEAVARLERAGHDVACLKPPGDQRRKLDPQLIADREAVFCSFPPENLDAMRALRWVQIASAGYSQLFGLDLPKRGVAATNALGCFDTPIAEWVVAMMVNLARDLRQMLRNQDNAVWDRSAVFQREIRGSTVGLWGYGGIGRETARLSRQLGLRVHVLTRNGVGPREDTYAVPGTGDPGGTLPDRVFTAGQELEFLAGLDFLVIAMPLTKVTEGIVGERELRALRPTAFVLNPSRGPIIQQEPLLRALRERWFAGAAIDTHYQYPLPPQHPLWKFPNVILTPHISGSSLSPYFQERIWDIFTQNVERLAAGRPLLNQLTPAQLSGA